MSTQVKAAAALVVVAAIAWVVWSNAFAGGSDVAAEAQLEIEVVQPTPKPPPEKVELVTPEPVPEKPAPTPRGRKEKAATTAAEEAGTPTLGRVVVPPPQSGPPGSVAGIVVDVYGQPVDASVTAVKAGGTYSVNTERSEEHKGKFEFNKLGEGEFTIQASTKDGRIALRTGVRIDSTQGVAGLMLTLEQGASLEITLEGVHDKVRCGLTSNGVLISDFSLHKGKPAKQTVPPGLIFLQVYSGAGDDRTVYEERSLSVFSGEENETTFTIQ